MPDRVSRRSFLRLAALTSSAMAFRFPPPEGLQPDQSLGRVTVDYIGVYKEPSFRSTLIHQLVRDQLLTLFNKTRSDAGPAHNPFWYQTQHGYAHTGHLQIVEWTPQAPRKWIPSKGGLFEVSVPFTRTYRHPDVTSDPLYRLYYKSTAWVTAVEEDSTGRQWYRLLDDLLKIHYYVRAEHLRQIPHTELDPISPEVPTRFKKIEVRLATQELICYEFEKPVFRTRISSGIPDPEPRANGIPTITPSGRFFVEVKMPARHMGDGKITSDLSAYELPGVPWVSFFTETGVAFHGTYWHNDFGRPKSHGCVNMHSDEARWLYRWTRPEIAPSETRRIARGTSILVI